MDLPSHGGSIGQPELCDGDGQPHDGDGGRVRPAVHLDVHWRVGQALGLSPDTTRCVIILYTTSHYHTGNKIFGGN